MAIGVKTVILESGRKITRNFECDKCGWQFNYEDSNYCPQCEKFHSDFETGKLTGKALYSSKKEKKAAIKESIKTIFQNERQAKILDDGVRAEKRLARAKVEKHLFKDNDRMTERRRRRNTLSIAERIQSHREQTSRYYHANKEKVKERMRKYRLENRDAILERDRRNWHKRNGKTEEEILKFMFQKEEKQ